MANVVDTQTKNDMREMYEVQKAALTQVSEKFGFSVNTVKAYIVEVGGTIRPRGRQVGFKATTNTRNTAVQQDVDDDTLDTPQFSYTEDGHNDYLSDYDNTDVEYENWN